MLFICSFLSRLRLRFCWLPNLKTFSNVAIFFCPIYIISKKKLLFRRRFVPVLLFSNMHAMPSDPFTFNDGPRTILSTHMIPHSLTIVYSTVYSDADQRKHQSSASLAFVRGIHRGPENTENVSIWWRNKQRVLMHGHQGWNVRHGLCHIYMIYVYIWVVYSFCLFCYLFIIVTTQFVALYKPCKPKPKFR